MTGSALFDISPGGRPRRELTPGAVHVPAWLTAERQRWIVGRFREWAGGPVPIRAAKVGGHEMSVQTVCLGWHWQPYRYTREATDVNGERVLPFPGWMVRLGRLALAAAAGDPRAGDGYIPDAALVNYYDRVARLGMHQDKDERSAAPVVSLSVGDSCTFRFGNTRDRGQPYEDVLLGSRRPVRLRRPLTPRLSRRHQDSSRDRPGRLRSQRRPRQHHHARHRPGVSRAATDGPGRVTRPGGRSTAALRMALRSSRFPWSRPWPGR